MAVMKFITAAAFSLLIAVSAYGEPYITIKKIDPVSLYPVIELEVSIADRSGKSPEDISEENILLYEDGFRIVNQLKMERIKNADDIFSLVFSIDSSRSISRKFLTRIKSDASMIVNSMGPEDRLSVYRFNDEVKLVSSFTTDKKRIIENIKGIKRHGNRTLLYNSIFDSLEVLEKIQGNRKAVIVFTDGKDEGSSVNEEDVIKMAKSGGLPVFFICLKTSKNIRKMSRISKLTGGRLVYSSDNENIAGIVKTLLSSIKERYKIKYRSALKRDGKDHSVEVKLKYDRLRDNHKVFFTIERSLFDISAIGNPILILLSITMILVILVIVILLYFIRKNKSTGFGTRGDDTTMPRIKPLPGEQFREESPDIPNETLLADDPEFSYSDVWLVEKNGPETGSRLPIYFNEVILGRSEEASIVINDDAVSLKHAKIKAVKNDFFLYDLVSENGTFLNGNKLLRPKPLYDWDIIKIGRTELIFRGSKTGN